MIIIEGLDASGKSTLAQAIYDKIGWPIQQSEGPEKYPGEIIQRCERYASFPDFMIFDRHPVISQSIYGPFAGKTVPPPYLLQRLKQRQPLVILSSTDNRFNHVIKPHDTLEHIDMINKKRDALGYAYLLFLREHFPQTILYREHYLTSIVAIATTYARKQHEK